MLPEVGPFVQPVTELTGIGPARARLLARLDIKTIGDLLLHLPRTYLQYMPCETLAVAKEKIDGEGVVIRGRVIATSVQRTRGRRHIAVEAAELRDETGSLSVRWFVPFRGPLPRPRLKQGSVVSLRGIMGTYGRERHLQQAENVATHKEEMVVPIYPLTKGISLRMMHTWINAALDLVDPEQETEVSGDELSMSDTIGDADVIAALRLIHTPRRLAAAEHGRRILALREIHDLRRNQAIVELGPHIKQPWPDADGSLIERFKGGLPFQPTKAQDRVMHELRTDMAGTRGMRRMLCGDVGTGKSLVIAYALLKAVEAGGQGLLAVPTRILAAQHHTTLNRLFAGLNVRIGLLTGQLPAQERTQLLTDLREGTIDVLVATQAAFQSDVKYDRLLVGVIDEQHRFGVAQRLALEDKAPLHALWVSATPIPKSMAQIVYGGIPVSFLDEKPPGRRAVETRWIATNKRSAVYAFLDQEISRGGRAYVVCPVIEGDEEAGIPGAIRTWERLYRQKPGGHQVALIHGRMSAEDQEAALEAFVQGDVRTLVATSMVEVGVDVPEATVMVIEGADRFGLAQLHQLRGRVGRGDRQSYAILLSDGTTPYARQRLHALRTTQDGFELADADLKLRGPGEFVGERQAGIADLRFADLSKDLDLFRRVAKRARRQAGKSHAEGLSDVVSAPHQAR